MTVAPRTTAPGRAATLPAGAPAAPAPRALRELPVLTRLPVAVLTAVLALSLLAPGAVAAAAVPVAVAGAVLGVPHGAADHLVPWWWSGRRRASRRLLVLVVVAYAAAAAVAAAALLLASTPALAAALVLSAVHFGRGEVVAWAERAGRPVPGPAADLLPCAAHGLAVVGLLLWRDPATTDPWVRPLSAGIADAVLVSRTAGLVLVAGSVAAATAWLLARHRVHDAAELLLVAAVFALAPPLAAFGAYFGLWHAVRHTGRLLDLARAAEGGRRWGPAARRLGRAAVVPSAVALAAVAVLWRLGDVAGLQAQVSVLLALTFPHAAVVWALDRRG
ncbi:Brp/Blh family beta-carotene 15,15'-monooxygenase [Geodermatophilus bullaregiensis]|uniref:beta-carotene 15,15'-dioxygenase, Brp/Blh family n=1 Tax=Geodermatophilus bullaregiensis TaxID=1564160 RepID=UPI00195D4398|nr:beta-carotene 15,15'-dioxygenase, Brp/Blh family [Geodermatophilus bullaregiensis]MBM7808151.1 Brp/Blh family beta-carotene 15,15'-monooxygenase [Geodermatophilus bullaregiensis]